MSFEAKHMQKAIDLAMHSIQEKSGGPFAAVIVRHGEVIGQGHNTVTASHDPTAHAEINAIRDACQRLGDFQLQDCEIYTTCEPCPMCLGAIYWARPKAIYYASAKTDAATAGFDDQFIYDEIALPSPSRKIKTQQAMRQEAQKVFTAWKNKKDKTEY
ncbi:tRNA-specific adenosine deaminase [Reichenbachiella sp. 5M10]|uniref:nucleoside deaminase n=1 Tax=Reichenbachiella sp. 5M10 TaxID=1889772 RepID=UPI000C1519CB|nr:nucleoside deaminase [Reichenbachiella sp. 5M10]PIB34085.1 tRNA-specific adenosine deaminase [Reichenbachiella sp. 5M10]